MIRKMIRSAMAWALLGALVPGGMGCGKATTPPAPSLVEQNKNAAELADRFKKVVADKSARPRKTELEVLQDYMAEYRSKYDADPYGPEAPALLSAMANISQQRLGDDAQAIHYYETIVLSFPDWEGTPAVYPLLAAAYERAQRMEEAQWIYERMMKVFPPTTPEFQFAREKMGLKPLPEETPAPEPEPAGDPGVAVESGPALDVGAPEAPAFTETAP